MENQKEWVSLQMDAPFYTNGPLSKEHTHLWFAFHGYGQLADHFMKRFDILDIGQHHIVACQGLSRFYLDAEYKKIGASWMTRLDREIDIIHQQRYISQVFHNRISKVGSSIDKMKLNYFAFSQGGATLLRWLKEFKPRVDNLIMWAADFPKEFTKEDFSFLRKDSNFFIVLGDKDPYRTMIDINRQKDLVESINCNSEIITFDGGHHVRRDVLNQLINKLQ